MALAHRWIWGANGAEVRGVDWRDEDTVVYTSGHTVVLYARAERSQQFIAGSSECLGFSALAVSPSKRFCAVAERADRASVVVYDLRTLRKRKNLGQQDVSVSSYTSICFSGDSETIFAIAGAAVPPRLVAWTWQKGKVAAAAALQQAPGAAFLECAHSPLDRIVTALSTAGLWFARAEEEELRLLPPCRERLAGDDALGCHCWLPHAEHRVVAGSAAGDLLLYDDCTFSAVLAAGVEGGVSALAACARGFVAGSTRAAVHVFAAAADAGGPETLFAEVRRVVLGGSPRPVLSVAPDPNEKDVVCRSADKQLWVLPLEAQAQVPQLAGAPPPAAAARDEARPLLTPFHGPGAVTGLDVCVRKPIVATCGLDRSVRVWNYLDHALELVKFFGEDPYSVALHPSGLHAAVGFADKLRLVNLLMDDLRVYREVPIKLCREVAFSRGGQYFAAVNGNVVSVYDFYQCDKLADLRGHNSKVRSLHWGADDATLVSCGQDGAVYLWDWAEGKRAGEFVQKGTVYHCALGTKSAVFAVGSDHVMKELEVPDLLPVKQLDGGTTLGQICLSHAEHMMFAGTAEEGRPGCVRAYSYPLTGDFLEYACLGGALTRMRVTHDDQYLVVAGEDGCVAVFDVKDRQERAARGGAPQLAWSEEILVTKSDLEEKALAAQELRNKIEELQLHNEYQLRLKDMSYGEKIKEVTEKYMQDLEQEKNKYELLREEKVDVEMECEERHRQMDDKHHHALQELENAYQQKIMGEVERYQQLVHERGVQRTRWDEQQLLLTQTHEAYVGELTDDFELKLEEDRNARLQLEDEKADLQREFDESQAQLEDDVDAEIQNLRHRYDAQLAAEREATLRYKGENGIMKKKFAVLTKDIEDQKEAIKALLGREKELQEQIKKLEREIARHKEEIKARDDTIGLKEKKIYELKKKNQELEKFKFVLDYKIKELKRQIEPRETEIATMKGRIKAMDSELESYHKSNAQLDAMIGALREKIDAMQKEILEQRKMICDRQARVKRSKAELHACVQHIQAPARLREAVEALKARHAAPAGARPGDLDPEVRGEYLRHEECLKRSLAQLQKKYQRDSNEHHAENMRLMSNNMGLIRDITRQREQNKQLRIAVNGVEARLQNQQARAKGPSPAAVAEQAARAQELQRHVDHLATVLEAAGVATGDLLEDAGPPPAFDSRGALPPPPGAFASA